MAAALFEWIYPTSWKQCPESDTGKQVGHLVDQAIESVETVKGKVKGGAESVKEGVEQVKAKMGEATGKVKSKVADTTENVKSKVTDATHKVWEATEQVAKRGEHFPGRLWEALLHPRQAMEQHNLVIRSRPDVYLLYLDVPGIPSQDLHVTLDGDNHLHLHGHHRSCIREDSQVCIEREIDHHFNLPEDAMASGIKAWLKDGILMIKVSRQPRPLGEQAVPVEEWREGWAGKAKKVLERVTGRSEVEDDE